MEYLSRRLSGSKHNKDFSFHPKCSKTPTISILFVDELLLFSEGNNQYVRLIKQEVEEFAATSRLCASVENLQYI